MQSHCNLLNSAAVFRQAICTHRECPAALSFVSTPDASRPRRALQVRGCSIISNDIMEQTQEGLAAAAATRDAARAQSKKRQRAAAQVGNPASWRADELRQAHPADIICPCPFQSAPVAKRISVQPPSCTHQVAIPEGYLDQALAALDPALHGGLRCPYKGREAPASRPCSPAPGVQLAPGAPPQARWRTPAGRGPWPSSTPSPSTHSRARPSPAWCVPCAGAFPGCAHGRAHLTHSAAVTVCERRSAQSQCWCRHTRRLGRLWWQSTLSPWHSRTSSVWCTPRPSRFDPLASRPLPPALLPRSLCSMP